MTSTVLGINFGNTYASLALVTSSDPSSFGQAECIANEDGERQIACAVSFAGGQTYVGNEAKVQLVKNAANTVVGFRQLLGRSWSEIKDDEKTGPGAPLVEHTEQKGVPAYKITIEKVQDGSEEVKYFSVEDIATIFLASLHTSALTFLGSPISGAVISIPSTFADAQKEGLKSAAEKAGIKVLQLLDEASSIGVAISTESTRDRTVLAVDVGASSLSLNVLVIREGLIHSRGTSHTHGVGGTKLDDALLKFFSSDFTKKNKIALALPTTSSSPTQDIRAEAKLRLALEHTKRTLSASPGAATCSVESLKDGYDYTGSINRMRFDMLALPVYTSICSAISELLSSLSIDGALIDEIVYIGGTASLPGLDSHLLGSGVFKEDAVTPFGLGTVVGGGVGDPTTIIARGSAIQAAVIQSIDPSDPLFSQFTSPTASTSTAFTSKTIALVFPADNDKGTLIPLVLESSPLPARRTLTFDVGLSSKDGEFAFEVWEMEDVVTVVKSKPLPASDDEGDDDEEVEDEEVKHVTPTLKTPLGASSVVKATQGVKSGKAFKTSVDVVAIVDINGKLSLELRETGSQSAAAKVEVAPSS